MRSGFICTKKVVGQNLLFLKNAFDVGATTTARGAGAQSGAKSALTWHERFFDNN